MIKAPRLAALTVVAVLSTTFQVFAQTRSWEGAVFPTEFGSQGERHYYTYGYYGPLSPPIILQKESIAAHAGSRHSSGRPRRRAIKAVALRRNQSSAIKCCACAVA